MNSLPMRRQQHKQNKTSVRNMFSCPVKTQTD